MKRSYFPTTKVLEITSILSEELEMIFTPPPLSLDVKRDSCEAGLWMRRQNRFYWRKKKKSDRLGAVLKIDLTINIFYQ